MALTLEIKPAEGPLSRIRLQPGSNRFTVRVGDVYRIFDDQTGLSPPGITVKRIDNSLVVDGLPPSAGEATTVEFAEFYTLCSAGSPCTLEVQPSLESAPVAVTPATASIGALADGAFVLYDPSYVPPEPPPDQGSFDPRMAWYGLGALAIAGLAAGGGGGDGGGGGAPIGNDGTLQYTGSPFVNSRTPTLVGKGEPGSQVLVRIDTDGDGAPNVSYATTVGPDFLWQINLATAAPTSGALPAGGLPDAVTVGITADTSQGLVALDPFVLAFDGVPPAPAVVNAVATDNVVNGPEKAAGVLVSGTSEPNGAVLVSWGGQSVAAAVDAAGAWQALFAAATVPADGSHPISVVALDQAGNAAEPTVVAVTVDTVPPLLGVASVAGEAGVNGLVGIADSDTVAFRGSSDPGASVHVSWNGFTRSTTVGGDGQWAIDFVATEVPQTAGGDFGYSIVASNAVGNVASAGGNVHVDLQAPEKPEIATVAGDNIVTTTERDAGVQVAGTAEPNARVAVTWGSTTHQVIADAAGAWQVGFAAAQLPTVASPGASTTITATATDGVGNAGLPASLPVFIQQPFQPPTISIVATDDVVNLAERNAGVTLSGTVDANAPGVTVTWGGFTETDTTVAGGTWSVTVPTAQVPTVSTSVVAAITGSPELSVSRPVTVDIAAPPAPVIGVVEGDDVVSVFERADGVAVSGTAEPGSTVRVTWGSPSKEDAVGGDGNWSVAFAPGEIPAAGPGIVTAVATDAAGNAGAPGSRPVTVDPPFNAPTINPVEGDDVVNAAERADGVTLSGTIQAGVSGVSVQWGSFSGEAQISGTNWSVAVLADQVPGDGNTTVVATILGTGGGAFNSRPVVVDATPPATPVVGNVSDGAIEPIEQTVGFEITGTTEAGTAVSVNVSFAPGGTALPLQAVVMGTTWTATVGALSVPSGTSEVTVTATAFDAAGNSTLSAPVSVPVLSTLDVDTLAASSDNLLLDAFAFPGSLEAGSSAPPPAATSLDALIIDDGRWTSPLG